MKIALTATAAIALALCAAPAGAQTKKPVELRIASFNVGSSWYVYGVTLAEVLRGKLPDGSKVDAPPLGGGTANPQLIERGKADIGLSFAVVNDWAMKGEFAFDKPQSKVRTLMGGLDDYYLGIVVNGKDRGPELNEFLDKQKADTRVMLLKKGSFGSFAGQQILDVAGSGEKEVAARGGRYDFADFPSIQAAFANGNADLFIQVITRGHPAVTEMAETGNVTLLEPSDKVLAAMKEKYGWSVDTLPKGSFRGQTRDLKLPGTTTAIIASSDMPDDLAYTIVKTVCENQDAFKAGHKALGGFDCATKAWKPDNLGAPLHPGAARYYRERGWM